jgi:hypothetical protein
MKIEFHGAYALKAKAKAKARKVKGTIKKIVVRGKRRYTVIKRKVK